MKIKNTCEASFEEAKSSVSHGSCDEINTTQDTYSAKQSLTPEKLLKYAKEVGCILMKYHRTRRLLPVTYWVGCKYICRAGSSGQVRFQSLYQLVLV